MADQRRWRFAVRLGLCRGLARDAADLLALELAFSAAGLAASGLAASLFAASGLLSVLVSGFVSGLASGLASLFASSFSAPCRFRLFSLSDLKSVSYQPEPLSRNTGADMSLRRPFLPQRGHFFRGLSVIFCSTSSSYPQ